MGFWEFFEVLQTIIRPYEVALKLLGLVFGPLLSALLFIYSIRDKQEMKRRVAELTRVRLAHAARRRRMAVQEQSLRALRSRVTEREHQVQVLQNDLRRITAGAAELWKLKPPRPFEKYREWFNEKKGARIVTVGNLKGGVGKTTIAANLAAYISEKRGLPVLLVDLDYQGSLSNMAMLAAGKEDVESNIDSLLKFDSSEGALATLVANEVHLAPKLAKCWLIPANYSLTMVESQMLLSWMLEEHAIDVRYRLANILLRPEIRRRFAAIIIDMPPRLSMASINGLVASHYFIVPTALDKLSAPAVALFRGQMSQLAREMNLGLTLAGVIGTLSRGEELSAVEKAVLDAIGTSVAEAEGREGLLFPRTIPRRASIAQAAGENFAVLTPDGGGTVTQPLLEELCEQICAAIHLDDWK